VRYRYGKSEYRITIARKSAAAECAVTVDGIAMPDRMIRLLDDGLVHIIAVGDVGTDSEKKPRSA
jgi:hypothetical protein